MKLPRFTLRDLFWLVLVVGIGCAWWLERREYRTRAARAEWTDSEPVVEWLESYLAAEGYHVKWLADGTLWVTSPDGKETMGIAPGAHKRP